MDENTPVYCCEQQGDCIDCGRCKDGSKLDRRQSHLYNLLSVASGYGFMQMDLSNDEHMSRDWDVTCDLLLREFDDYVKFTMDFAGYAYSEFTEADCPETVFAEIRRSIDADKPVLMQFRESSAWVVVTGYDDEGRIYGYDGSYGYWGKMEPAPESYDGKLFRMADWQPAMSRCLVLGEPFQPTLTLLDAYRRALRLMEHNHGLFDRSEAYMREDANFAGLDADGLLRARDRVSQFIGLPIDMRSVVSWHLPVPADKALIRYPENLAELPTDPSALPHLMATFNSCCCFTHDTLWIAWRAIGEFMGGDRAEWGARMADPATRRVVADVIGVVAHYDRDMYSALKTIVGE